MLVTSGLPHPAKLAALLLLGVLVAGCAPAGNQSKPKALETVHRRASTIGSAPGSCPGGAATPTTTLPSFGTVVGTAPVFLRAAPGKLGLRFIVAGFRRKRVGLYAIKTDWVLAPNYQGSAVLSGKNLRNQKPVEFQFNGATSNRQTLSITSASTTYDTVRGLMEIPAAGCYQLKVTSAGGGSWTAVFAAGR